MDVVDADALAGCTWLCNRGRVGPPAPPPFLPGKLLDCPFPS